MPEDIIRRILAELLDDLNAMKRVILDGEAADPTRTMLGESARH